MQLLLGEQFRRLTGQSGGLGGNQRSLVKLPEETASYLRSDNPRLDDLRQRYSRFKRDIGPDTGWTEDFVLRDIDLHSFRADNAYVYQFRDWNTAASFALTGYYIKTMDGLSLMKTLEEDGLFGAYVFDFNGECLISRDLVDSIVEISFLNSVLELARRPQYTILDIGAGYGRFAHRVTRAFPRSVQLLLTDAIAVSTFLSEFYLRFRGCEDYARVIPLDQIESVLDKTPVDLATNIHSFSECPMWWICWWLDLLERHRVRHLMIVPNEGKLTTNERIDYRAEIERRGYRLIVERPKYEASIVQSYGVSPTRYYLYQLGD